MRITKLEEKTSISGRAHIRGGECWQEEKVTGDRKGDLAPTVSKELVVASSQKNSRGGDNNLSNMENQES